MKLRKPTIIAAFAALLLLIYCNNRPEVITDIQQQENTLTVKPPLKDLQNNIVDYKINPSKDTLIKHNPGTQIRIPKDAFMDEDGNVIKTDVTVSFRSFTNPIQIFLSGIPMGLTVDNQDKVLESAGMVEIQAQANSKKVFTNPNSLIEVDFLSLDSSSEFNVYNLDTISGDWQLDGKDAITIDRFEEELKQIPYIPTAPKVAGLNTFSLEDTKNEISVISMYEDVLFEPVSGEPCGSTATNIEIEDLKNGTFKINFIVDLGNTRIEESCICNIVFREGVEYDNAMKVYQKKYAKTIKANMQKRALIQSEWNTYKSQIKKYNEYFLRQEFDNLNMSEKITRTLTVNNFGFINIDKPTDYPVGASFLASFVDQEDQSLSLSNVVLIEKERNVLFRYDNQIKFNPEKENILCGVTSNGELAYFSQFDSLEINSSKQTLKMNILSQDELSYDAIFSSFLEND